VRGVDDALALAGAFSRARKKDDSVRALERAKEIIEELERQYPSAAAPLRERFERVRTMVHATSPRTTLAPAPTTLSSSAAQDAVLATALAIRKALLTRDRPAFITAIVTLENLARALPEEQRTSILTTVTSMRQRIQTLS
jgi:ABC-type microcin C transport system duplicated ATPase subunit YejF